MELSICDAETKVEMFKMEAQSFKNELNADFFITTCWYDGFQVAVPLSVMAPKKEYSLRFSSDAKELYFFPRVVFKSNEIDSYPARVIKSTGALQYVIL